jgi:adenylate cyclase
LAQPGGTNPKPFRRARLWLASLIAISLGATVSAFIVWNPSGRAVELLVGDYFRRACPLSEETTDAAAIPMTVIAIDDSAINRFGHWPWPWTRLAEIVDLLHELGARLVFLDVEFPERDALHVVEETQPDGRVARQIVDTVPGFVASVRRADNILIPFSVYFEDRPHAGGEAARPGDKLTPEQAKARAEALEALARYAADIRPDEAPGLKKAEALQPMIAELGRACTGSGYTSVLGDREDGVVRRVRLVARTDDRVYPHLALTAAGYWLFGPHHRVMLQPQRVVLASADGKQSVGVPVDDAAQVDLRWPPSVQALNCISVSPILNVADMRCRYRSVMRQLDHLFPDLGWAAADQRLRDAQTKAGADGADRPTGDDLRALRKAVVGIEDRLATELATRAFDADAAAPADDQARRVRALAEQHLDFLASYHSDAGVKALLEALRPHVAGRLCLVGSFSTGTTDLHRTPMAKSQPGVTVYPAAIRTILSGVAFRHLGPGQEWAVAVLAAWLTAVATVRLSTLRGVAATLGLSGLIVAAAWTTSAGAAVLLPVAGPVLSVVLAFAGISAYRQLTEASTRRWITRVFEQYNSADLVEEIVRNPDRLRLGGERLDITILFSDIEGFTPLSERLEPERLVALLNRYLSAMTTLFQAEKGSLDKYVGDGIMAFFGAPIALPDHALRAVRAALAMQDALPQVNRDLATSGLLPPDTQLAMRIGCSSGPTIVGNFGSEQRFNYTCSGDTVNLGARLEEANRWLGSRILVSESTRAACGQAVLFRPFGPARIRGKAQPIPLYEPLALEPAPADLKHLAETYGRAIAALAAGDVPAAEAALADLLATHPDDRPAQVLRDRIAAVKSGQASPQEPWNLARPK